MNVDKLIQSEHVKLAIQLKTNQLQREQLSSIKSRYVEATLINYSWKIKKPVSINEAVNDILQLTIGEILAYLTNEAVIVGSQMELSDFGDLINQKGK